MTSRNRHESLEGLIDRALRGAPLRTAPATLERRVLGALERRAARPWWRKDFVHWPVIARLAFLVAAAGVVRLLLGAPSWVRDSAAIDLPAEVSWIQATTQAFSLIVQHLPSLLVYGALAALIAGYAALFAFGAIAYRSLFSRDA